VELIPNVYMYHLRAHSLYRMECL